MVPITLACTAKRTQNRHFRRNRLRTGTIRRFAPVYYPLQILLDYPLAFGCLGLAGFFKKYALVGVVVGVTGRFVMHLVSGAVFFAEFAPED